MSFYPTRPYVRIYLTLGNYLGTFGVKRSIQLVFLNELHNTNVQCSQASSTGCSGKCKMQATNHLVFPKLVTPPRHEDAQPDLTPNPPFLISSLSSWSRSWSLSGACMSICIHQSRTRTRTGQSKWHEMGGVKGVWKPQISCLWGTMIGGERSATWAKKTERLFIFPCFSR